LSRARVVALDWGRDIDRLSQDEEDKEALKSLGMRALEILLTCLSSFAVDKEHLSEVLQTSDNIADATESYITIHDRCPAVMANLPQPILTLLRRCKRTSHSLEAYLCKYIVVDLTGIDCTMQRVWSGYRPGISWRALPAPNDRWLESKTSDQGNHSLVTVHYNLLNRTLLVNGLPLTRLPSSYELHLTYRRFLREVCCSIFFHRLDPGTNTAGNIESPRCCAIYHKRDVIRNTKGSLR
jgi:hypothetical protein